MATYTYANVGYLFDNSGGTPVAVEVLSINGVNIKAACADMTPNGVAYARKLFGGLLEMDDLVLELVYDDTASTGTDALFNDPGCKNTAAGTRTFKITYGGTKYTSVETIIAEYDRKPVKGAVHTQSVTLAATGTITEN